MSKKTYIGISRDHSGSMRHIAHYAARDYNQTIEAIKEASKANDQDTIMSVVECGAGNASNVVRKVVMNSSLSAIQPLSESAYIADGSGTPLWDSVGDLITMMENVPDAKDPDVSFLVMAITDGEENSSYRWTIGTLKEKIKKLQNTDRWTFVFRVPRGYSHALTRFGIPAGNILEWEQSKQGMEKSTIQTREAFTQYYASRSLGATSSSTFYVNAANLNIADVKANLVDISSKVKLFGVNGPAQIRPFIESMVNGPMEKGAAFYQLTKPEKEVQDYKLIAIRDKTTGAVYGGANARDLLGLPHFGTVRVAPDDHGNYDIFIQSTSVNRKLVPGSFVLYWPGAGVHK